MMRELPTWKDGPLKGKTLAPTFENLSLGTREEAFESLKVLGDRAIAGGIALGQSDRITDLVGKAISLMSPDGEHAMHLPDVKAHWNGNVPIDPNASDSQAAIAAE